MSRRRNQHADGAGRVPRHREGPRRGFGTALAALCLCVTAGLPSGPAMAEQTSPPTNVDVTAGDQSLTVTWSWTDGTGGVCPLTGGNSGFEIQYKKTSETNWRDASQVNTTVSNNTAKGAYELATSNPLYSMSPYQFTIDASATGFGEGQGGVALDNGAEYQVRLIAYSVPCESDPHEPNSAYSDTESATPVAPGSPRVTSITRTNPYGAERTTSDTLKWQVTFSEDVKNVGAADFELSSSDSTNEPLGSTTLTVAADGSSKTVYDVTASGGNLANLDATVTLGFASGQDIKDLADNALMNTTPTGTNDNDYLLDNTAPSLVSITRQSPGVKTTAADTLTWRLTFSEPVFDVWADIGDTHPSDNFNDFKLTISPAPDNPPTVKTTRVGGYDLDRNPAYPISAVFDVEAYGGDLATLDGEATLTTSDDCHFVDTADLYKLQYGPNKLECSGTAPLTPDTNNNTFMVLNSAPTVAITGVPKTANAAFTATFTFSHAVTGFEVGDIDLTNAIALAFTETVPGTTWTALITPTADGAYEVSVAADAAADAVNRGNVASATKTGTYDTTVPGITITGVPAAANGAFTATFTFSKAVTGFEIGEITLTNATADAFTNTALGTTWTALITPTALGAYDVSVAANVAVDAANNNNSASGTHSGVYDTDAPTVEITGVLHVAYASMTVTFTFSEAMRDFVAHDITLVNATDSAFTETVAGKAWTARITPTANGRFYVSVEDDAATDLAGNGNRGSTIHSGTYTKINPRVESITRHDPETSPTDADKLTWHLYFDEKVEHVDKSDFTLDFEPAISGAQPTVSDVFHLDTLTDPPDELGIIRHIARRWQIEVSGGDLAGYNGTVTLGFASGQNIKDADSNALIETTPTGTDDSFYVLANDTAPPPPPPPPDTTNPRVTAIERQSPASSPTNAATLTWRVTFDEAVRYVDAADFTVAGTTATLTVDGTSRTIYDVTASGGDLAGLNATVTLSFASGQNIEDPAGNALSNTTPTGTNDNDYLLDNTAPTVTTIARQAPASSPTNAETLTWRVTFDEAVQHVDKDDFTVSGTTATVTAAPAGDSETVYDVTASGGDLAGLNAEVTLSFVANPTIEDLANNPLRTTTPTGTNDPTYVVDTTPPTVTITGVPATAHAAFTATFTFSEPVTGFAVGDLGLTNATASAFTETKTGTTWTALITPTADGDYSVSVPADVATDAAGNGNTVPEPQRGTYTTDTTPPTVTAIARQAPPTSSTSDDVLTWRVTFDEAVQGVHADDFTVSGTTATLAVAADGTSRTVYDVTAAGGDLADLNAEVTLGFAGNQHITDPAGNPLADTTATGANERTYEVDNTPPTVTITGVPETAHAAFTATFTFSQPVTGFEVGDIRLTNATAAAFTETKTGTTWTALITPTADGAYTVAVAAEVALDAAGNGNTVTEPRRGTYVSPRDDLAEALNRVILPEVARAMADQTVGAIGRRVAQARQATRTLEIGGQSTLADVVTTHGPTLADGTLNLKGLLSNSAFVLPLQAQPGAGLSHLTLWGNGAYRNLGGEAGAVDWDGDLLSARLGVDARLGQDVLAGLAVAWQQGNMDYTQTALSRQGDYDTTLTSLHPYLGWTAPDRGLELWATAGYGWGDLTITDGTQQRASDLTAQTLGAGGSSRLWATEATKLRLRGEALHTQMDIEGSATLAAQTVEARRVRLALEGSRTQALAGGAQLRSNLELGLRHDAGDGRTGTGAEVGGGLRYTDPARRLTLATQARVLLLHGGDYEDWGISGTLQLEPAADGQGLAVRVQPGWGQSASRVSALWAQDAVAGLNGPPAQEGRVDMQVGYGVAWAEALVTPYGTMGLTTGRTRAYGLGSRLTLGSGLQFNLEGLRQETVGAPVDHGVRLELGVAW